MYDNCTNMMYLINSYSVVHLRIYINNEVIGVYAVSLKDSNDMRSNLTGSCHVHSFCLEKLP